MSAESAATPVPAPAPLRDSSSPIKAQQASESKETADQDKSRELEEIRSMVNSLKERNARLERLNQALSVELKDLISERTSIECKFLQKETGLSNLSSKKKTYFSVLSSKSRQVAVQVFLGTNIKQLCQIRL